MHALWDFPLEFPEGAQGPESCMVIIGILSTMCGMERLEFAWTWKRVSDRCLSLTPRGIDL